MSTQYRPFNHIPLELLQPIFQNLRRWELVPVALTCRSFNDAARRLLWADCDLTLFAKSPRPKNSNLFHAVESRQWDDVRLRLNSFSKEPMGGLVRSLTLRLKSFDQENDEDNDSDPENDPDHQQFQDQIQMARKMAKDIAEEPSALRSLYVDISFLDTPSDFAENLQYLQLELMDFYCYLHGVRQFMPIPTFPKMKELKITWSRFDPLDAALNRFYPPLLTLVCQYLRRTPRLECFCLFIDRTNPMIQTSPLRSIAPMFPEDIESVAGSLFIPTMRRLELTLSQGFLASTFLLYPGARTGEKKQLPVEQLFRNFALRHTDVIERFLWFSVEESLPESAGYRPRRSIPILNGATHMTIDRPCERKGRKNLRELRKSHNEKLRSLRLAHFMFEVDETGWLIENVLPFRNLVKLKLHDWWATDDIASAVMGIPTCGDSFLGHYSMDELAANLPQSLECLTISVRKALKTEQKGIDQIKRGADVFFYGLERLNTLKLKLLSLGQDMLSTISQTLRCHRRPNQLGPVGSKKICFWHIFPIHAERGLPSHRILKSYSEVPLIGLGYKGPDALLWSWADQLGDRDVMDIKCCALSGKAGGCRHWLSARNFWVALPPDRYSDDFSD